ncbi:hypothetical protein P0E66_14580 [Enterococcus faecalis]|uniref:hypothetical protein n=1 Tax=Enterococcus faecalis TaxID=1351 RepID=UPI0025B05B40|nr:hypothetical protein [Enterococcus faecalis]MDN3202351.1 hypothetical protein [Enterococcus faecalis]
MEWMDLEVIQQIIIENRNKNFQDQQQTIIQKNIQYALDKIKNIKEDAIKQLQIAGDQFSETFYIILEAEAKITNIINVINYAELTKEDSFRTIWNKERKFMYSDYLKELTYFSSEYQNISILARFYVDKLCFNK